jgi:hypothetical protein
LFEALALEADVTMEASASKKIIEVAPIANTESRATPRLFLDLVIC